MAWYNFWKPKVKQTPVSSGSVVSKGGPIAGDTPVGYVGTPPPIPKTGTTRVVYSGGGGGGSRTITTPSGGSTTQTAQQVQAQQQAQAEAQRVAEAQRQEVIRITQQQAQKIEQQRQQEVLIAKYGGGTRITPTTADTSQQQVYRPGTIYETQVDTFKHKGKTIPVTKTYTIGEDWSSREATMEEREKLEEYEKAKRYEEVFLSEPPSKISRFYQEKKGEYLAWASQPFIDEKWTRDLFSKGGKVGEFTGAMIYGAIGTKGDLFRTGAIYGATLGGGYIIKGGTSLATSGAGYLFGAKVGGVTGTSIRVATMGAGVYFGGTYLYGRGQQFYYAPDLWEKGKVTGRTTSDVVAGVYGFKHGAKLYDITEGYVRTRGREFIDIPQGEYPTAPTSKHLELFKKNIYPELSGKDIIKLEGYTGTGTKVPVSDFYKLHFKVNIKPGAFHTTGDTFWKSGTITPQPGTSELPGLYGSTQISTPFARITGSSSTAKFNFNSWMKSLLSPPGKPGVAYLQPEGFRYSSAKPGKWYSSAKPGYADVPGIKTEIEAIFRPKAGGYGISSKGYYTKISGVRVPIDSFVYDPSIITGTTTGGVDLVGGSVSYPGYSPPPYVDLTGGIIAVSSSTISTPEITSITPSYSSVSSSTPPVSSVVPSYKPSKSYAPSSVSYKAPSSKVSSSITPPVSSVVSSYKPSRSYIPYGSSVTKIPRSYYPPAPPTKIKYFPKGLRLPKQKLGRFPVYGRRFKKWKPIGIGRTEKEAFSLGKEFARKTLGVTFKIPKAKARKLPGYKTKISKKGEVLYIEPRKRRLKKRGLSAEIPEIQFYRGLKAKSKKMKGGKKKK